MPTFRSADRADIDLLREVMEKHHTRLIDVGVTVGLLHAHAARDKHTGQPKGPALKLHGEACYATVKINSQKDRVEGKPDATVVLDGDTWSGHPHEKKVAILDHELAHLLVVIDEEEGGVKLDDANRPVLKMRLHDFTCAGFWDVVDRHKKEAVESQQYLELFKEMSQRVFPWG